MTSEEFQKLVEQSQPHKVFKNDWATFYPIDFADTLLPNVPGYVGKAVWMYDGANLFNGLQKAESKVLQLTPDKELISLISYSYPKGVDAETKKERVRPGEHEVTTFIEVAQDEEIEIFFKLGYKFRNFLTDYFKQNKLPNTINSIENKPFKTDISSFKEYFNRALVHYNMMDFIGKTIGADFVAVDNKTALKVKIIDIKAWQSKPPQKEQNNKSTEEKHFIIEFEILNQIALNYSLRVIRNKEPIFTEVYLPEVVVIGTKSDTLPNKTANKQESSFPPDKYKIIWDCSQNDIFETKDEKQKLLFRVEATGKDKQRAFDEKEITVKKLVGNAKQYNDTEFDKNRVVVWLTKDFTPEKELLPSNTQTKTETVFAGAKLIRLRPATRDSELTPALFWWNNAYHIQEFSENLLGDTNEIFEDKAGMVFQNDIIHTAHRATFVQSNNDALTSLIKDLESKKENTYSTGELTSALSNFKYQFRVDFDDRVETINRFLTEVRKVYEPLDENGGKIFDRILYIPLTKDWFEKYDDEVKKRYETYWKKENGFNAISSSSGGEVFYKEGTPYLIPEDIYNEMKNLLKLEADEKRQLSKEWLWINELQSPEDDLTYIFFSIDAWESYSHSFAGFVGLEQAFGVFRLPSLLTVMLHESSQGIKPTPIPRDSHTGFTDDKWKELSDDFNNFKDDEEDFIRQLYVADHQIATIGAAIILSKL